MGTAGSERGQWTELASMEEQLASALNRAVGEVSHIECLDTEQRAEIYAILETLRLDTRAHRELVSALAGGGAGRAGDA